MMALLIAGILAARPIRIEPPAPCPDEGRIPISESTKITEPGYYYLIRDIAVESGSAITIVAPEVTLDLNGHTVTSASTGVAIEIIPFTSIMQIRNVHLSVKNGRLRGGGGISLRGEDFGDPEMLSLEGLDIEASPNFGLDLGYFEGRGEWVVNVQNSKISGGIQIQSNRISMVVRTVNNTIEGGIHITHPETCEISGNIIRGGIVMQHDHGENVIHDNTVDSIEIKDIDAEGPRGRNRILNNLIKGGIVISTGFGGNVIQGNTVGSIETNPGGGAGGEPGGGDRILDNLLKGGGILIRGSDTRIEGNQIIGSREGPGVEVGRSDSLPKRVHIEGNQIHGFGDCGIRFHSGDDHVYRNNNVRGNGVPGISGECGGSLGTNLDAGGNVI